VICGWPTTRHGAQPAPRRPRCTRLRLDHGAHADHLRADYDALIARVVDMGYTAKNIRKLPQQWPDGAGGPREGE
jgi:hypothetical protein